MNAAKGAQLAFNYWYNMFNFVVLVFIF